VVAVLEEILFRGAVFGALRKVFHWAFALVLSSMIYAIVHFMEPAKLIGTVTWLSGLELLPRMLGGFTNLHAIFPGFLNLTFAGILLGWAYQRTGDLYFSIGLHAGWIFWLKSYGALTAEVPGATTWWWGTSRLIDGWFALPVLAVTLRLFLLMPIGPRKGRPA
jgi:membrane protease YdiL (CAAX protease family)